MATFSVVEPDEGPRPHQHPALLCVGYTIRSDQFRLDRFPTFVEKQVPRSWHVELHRVEGYELVDFYYSALGAWPADAARQVGKIGLPHHAFENVSPEAPAGNPYTVFHRLALCGHSPASNGDCTVPVAECHDMVRDAMLRVRAPESWRPFD